jgi:hypothetical protein
MHFQSDSQQPFALVFRRLFRFARGQP